MGNAARVGNGAGRDCNVRRLRRPVGHRLLTDSLPVTFEDRVLMQDETGMPAEEVVQCA